MMLRLRRYARALRLNELHGASGNRTEGQMRFSALAILVALVMALATTSAPAQSQWKSYVSRDLGFWFMAPGQVKAERGTYKGQRSGQHPAIIFGSMDNNIEYKALVVDMNARVGESASLLEEAVVTFQEGRRTVMDN